MWTIYSATGISLYLSSHCSSPIPKEDLQNLPKSFVSTAKRWPKAARMSPPNIAQSAEDINWFLLQRSIYDQNMFILYCIYDIWYAFILFYKPSNALTDHFEKNTSCFGLSKHEVISQLLVEHILNMQAFVSQPRGEQTTGICKLSNKPRPTYILLRVVKQAMPPCIFY